MKTTFAIFCLMAAGTAWGQAVEWNVTTENAPWQTGKTRLEAKPKGTVDLKAAADGPAFRAWGTTFNELDWDAFALLSRADQEELLDRLFAPDGDLRFTRGRIPMNASDYARSWYSCDEVSGDLELRYFNIDRDKTSIIPLIKAAQSRNPEMTFWTSPWSPPSWMKINHDYPVVSSKFNNADPDTDYLLYGTADGIDEDEMKFLGERKGAFPKRLATQDYMIQDPRYLQAYANYFCKFIDEYADQGIPIDRVIYQNEAYSYTPYPGCPWTAEGTIRFNRDYLAPTLRAKHPDVELYLGTINSNRQDHVERILADDSLRSMVKGVGFQWEGREIMPSIRAKYPELHYICSESECGWGSFDWGAGEHTFFLIADNAGNGADEWYNWNFLLPTGGESPWGWKQNALIELKDDRTVRYTPEFYAVKHFSNAIAPGSKMTGYMPRTADRNVLAISWLTPEGKHVVVAGNFTDTPQPFTAALAGKYLNVTLLPHSFNTFRVK